MTTPTLRTYQHDAVEAVFREWETHASTMIVMATGLGKTFTFCEIIRRIQPKRAIIIAHRSELIQQAANALEKIGLRAEIEMAEKKSDASMFHNDSVIVASVQTLISGPKDDRRMKKFRPEDFGLLVIDECFARGTLVDGVPIELIRPGDEVRTHKGKGKVIALFKKPCNCIVRVTTQSGVSIICTGNHPIWTDRGFVPALLLTRDDMVLNITRNDKDMPELREGVLDFPNKCATDVFVGVRKDLAIEAAQASLDDDLRLLPKGMLPARGEAWCGTGEAREGLLLGRVQGFNAEGCFIGNNGSHESKVCVKKNEREEPDVSSRNQSEGQNHASSDGVEASGSGREWKATSNPSAGVGVRLGMAVRSGGANEETEGMRLSDVLQDRHSGARFKDWNRSGRSEPQLKREEISGPEEGEVFNFVRVASVEVFERGSGDEFERLCPDGFVYNLEVSNGNTYFANGILVHNCHHSVASSYREVLNHFKSNPSLKVLGVSATPDRLDSKALGMEFQSVAYKYDIAEAIEDGYLVPIEQQMIHTKIDYSNIRTTAGDLNGADLAQVMEDEAAVQGMVGASIKIIGNRPSIAFTSSVRHAEMCCEIFNRHRPGMAAWICGKTPAEERSKVLRQYKAGEIQVIANVGIATEGFDSPNTECIIVGRPTKSRALYTQMVGRGTRSLAGTLDQLHSAFERREAIAESPKPSCLVLDFVGNSGKHKLITTADILGGKYDEETRSMAVDDVAKSGGAVRMADALKKADEKIRERIEQQKRAEAARKAKLIAQVQFSARTISPFDLFQITPRQDSKWDTGRPLSEKQKGILRKMGVNPDDIGQAAARQLLHKHFERMNKGLASVPQMRALLKNGYTQDEIKKMTFAQAHETLDWLAKNNWKRTDKLIFA